MCSACGTSRASLAALSAAGACASLRAAAENSANSDAACLGGVFFGAPEQGAYAGSYYYYYRYL